MSDRRRNRPPTLRMPSNAGALDNEGSATSSSGGQSSSSTSGAAAGSQQRPPLRWRASERSASRRFQYSTDDDEAEIEADLEREYFEGYSDGLKNRRLGRRGSKSPMVSPGPKASPSGDFHLPPAPENPNLRHRRSHLIEELTEDNNQAGDTTEAASHLRHDQDQQDQDADATNPVGNDGGQDDDDGHHRKAHAHGHSRNTSFNQQEYYGGDHDHGHGHGHSHGHDHDRDHDHNEYDHDHHSHHLNDGEDDVDSDNESSSSVETFTLRERQDAINTTHPFGIRIWKPAVYKKIRSVQQLAEGDIHSTPGKAVTWGVLLGNLIWSLLFGSLIMIICLVAAGSTLLIPSKSARRYGKLLFSLGLFFWFPFGKFVELVQQDAYILEDEGEGRSLAEYERWQAGDVEFGRLFFEPTPRSDSWGSEEDQPLLDGENGSSSTNAADNNDIRRKRRLFGRGKWTMGRIMFYFWYYLFLAPVLYTVSLVCWLGVFSLPMSKVTSIIASHLRRHPLAIKFKPASSYGHLSTAENSSIILCTYRAFGLNYYKYTIDGTNIFFINLMFPVLFVIFDWYALTGYSSSFITSSGFVFTLAMLSIIPLAYFIGQAVASISAQSSMGMGAAINAFFSTIVEIFLYAVALNQGKGELVEGSIVGSILAGILLMPGLSMCSGAIKRKTQRYNPRSAGVSSTMLIFAVIGAFAPTLFYQVYGTYELRCTPCDTTPDCKQCQMYQVPLQKDTMYTSMIRPFSNGCAILLFVSYVIGLWFTLRTHAAMIWTTPTSSELPQKERERERGKDRVQSTSATREATTTATNTGVATGTGTGAVGAEQRPAKKHVTIEVPPREQQHQEEEAGDGGGHDAPNWSRTKSTVILLGATWLYAIIAEILVDTVDVVLQSFSISEKLLGIFVFSLVPNTTEFLNAISFAVNGNIALSMEIGSAYALQVCLLQIPGLVLYSSTWSIPDLVGSIHDYMFTLVFPRWDLCMVILCVFLFSYIYAEGKSNYFKGSILILAYLVALLGFVFADLSDEIAGISQKFIISTSNI